MARKNSLLNISTIAPEPVYITIDDVDFELRRIDQLGIKEQARIASMTSRCEALQISKLSSDEDIIEVVALYDETMKAMVPKITDEALDRLRVEQYKAIINLFTETSLGEAETTPAAETTQEK